MRLPILALLIAAGCAAPDASSTAQPDLRFAVIDDSTHADDMAHADLAAPPPPSKWVTGYYAGYASATYPVGSIYWDGLTHLAVAFFTPKSDGTLDTALYQSSASTGLALAKQLVDAAHAHGKKAIISIGGASSRSTWVAATSSASLATFTASLVALLQDPGFDGIDLDWEPVETADGPLLKALLDGLRAAAPTAILTMPVYPLNTNALPDLSLYVPLAADLDQMNVMTYGMAGAYTGWKSWHSSALHQSSTAAPMSVQGSVEGYVAAGIDRSKLGVGAGAYGLCYTSPVTGPLQALGTATVKASVTYASIVEGYTGLSGAVKAYDTVARVPYLSFATDSAPTTTASKCRYITYEDPQSLTDKAAFVKSEGYGGVIVWTINHGYLPSAAVGQRDPLLAALKTGLLD